MPKCHTLNAAFDIFLFLASNSSGRSLWIIKMCAKMCKALANYDVLINFGRQVWQFWWILIFFRLGAAGKRNKFSAWVASVAEHYGVDQHLLDFARWWFQVLFAASTSPLPNVNCEQLQMSYECFLLIRVTLKSPPPPEERKNESLSCFYLTSPAVKY